MGSGIRGLGFSRVGIELQALAALLLVTAALGRSFSKLEVGFSWLHPTEVMLGIVLVLALARVPLREGVARLQATRVLIPLALFWIAGAIATARGLVDWGFSLVLHDIGLVEYSLIVPLIAFIVRDRAQFVWLCRVIALGGLAAMAVFAATLWTPLEWNLARELNLIMFATGMYVGIYVVWPLAHRAAGVAVSAWQYPAAVLGVTLVVIGVARASWLGLLTALLIVMVYSLPRLRASTVAIGVAVLILGVGLSIPAERLQFGTAPQEMSGATEEGGETVGPFSDSTNAAPGAVNEVTASFSTTTSQQSNAQWRLAFWEYMIKETASQPVVGTGFGEPSNFEWNGTFYDPRSGNPMEPFDVSGPHNSFVNVLYRTGAPGFVALIAIMLLAVIGLVRSIRRSNGESRALATWLLAALAITSAVASLSVALEGSFMGIFFWSVLGLSLLAPQMLSRTAPGAQPATDAPR